MKGALSLLFGILLFSAGQAQVYEWFDAAGNRHFSDQKPDGVEFRELADPAARLSSYKAAETRQPRPPVVESRAGSASSGQARRPSARPATENTEAVCDNYLARIDRIHDRLRAGYDEPAGNRLRARRSALRAAYRRDCN